MWTVECACVSSSVVNLSNCCSNRFRNGLSVAAGTRISYTWKMDQQRRNQLVLFMIICRTDHWPIDIMVYTCGPVPVTLVYWSWNSFLCSWLDEWKFQIFTFRKGGLSLTFVTHHFLHQCHYYIALPPLSPFIAYTPRRTGHSQTKSRTRCDSRQFSLWVVLKSKLMIRFRRGTYIWLL